MYKELSPGQTIATFSATYPNIVGRNISARVWPPCCDLLGVVGSNLKMVKFFTLHLRMLHDVVVVWPGSCNNVASRYAH